MRHQLTLTCCRAVELEIVSNGDEGWRSVPPSSVVLLNFSCVYHHPCSLLSASKPLIEVNRSCDALMPSFQSVSERQFLPPQAEVHVLDVMTNERTVRRIFNDNTLIFFSMKSPTNRSQKERLSQSKVLSGTGLADVGIVSLPCGIAFF